VENQYKLSFWKKIKYSIFDFEAYQDLAAEKVWKTILYIMIFILTLSIVSAGIYTFKVSRTIQNIRLYIDENIESIEYKDNKLTVLPKNNQETIRIEESYDFATEIVINTNIIVEEITKEAVNELTLAENAILILGDSILIKSEILTTPYAYKYSEIAEMYNINYLDKAEVIRLLSTEIVNQLYLGVFGLISLYLFIIHFSNTLIDILILSVMGYLVSIMSRMRLKYSAIYNISAYALTLPIILNIIYIVLNALTGFNIKYFEIMYTAIAYIYIIAAILLIRSDVIKKQIELAKIIQEQDKVREELIRREEEKKEAERERQRKEEEKKQQEDENKESDGQEEKNTESNDKPDVNIGKEPEGNNV